MEPKLRLQKEVKRTWLIQRLNKPEGCDNPFSFGGGYVNGGLSDKAMGFLRSVWSFDYMGSAEFEWGAVPNAIAFIVEQEKVTGKVRVGGKSVWYICPPTYEKEVKERISQLAKDEHTFRLKEHCGLKDALEGQKYARGLGWLELDNGFAFFIDFEMFQKFCRLLGVNLTKELTEATQ